MSLKSKSIWSASAVCGFLVGISVLACGFSFADDKRPERGSIEFGAEKKPEVTTSPQFESFKTVFADVAEKVIPSVVSVTSTKIDTVVYRDPFSQFFWGSPFEHFFGNPRGGDPRGRGAPPQQTPKIIPRSGVGSGVIVSSDGHILTNYHVIGDADEISIETADERKYDAEIVGVDSLSDVAVIKIKGKVDNLPVAYLGNSDNLRPGDWVMAIGNPFNLASTVTTGIVSALGRRSGAELSYQNFIQTDAAINPGNSGGALVNIEGEVIGINTMIFTRSGGYMGIGFAIPINMAEKIMEDLIYEGEVSRGWLGVTIQDLDQASADALGLEDRKGVLIPEVFDGQPADKAGIKQGDVIVSVDGKPVDDANELRNRVATIRPGTSVPVELVRKGKKMKVTVKIAKRDEEKVTRLGGAEDEGGDEGGAEEASKLLGIRVGALSEEIREQLNVTPNTKGAVILEVEPSSQAAMNRLQKGDIIMEINQRRITSVEDYKKAAKGLKAGQSVLFLIQRQGRTMYVAFKIRK